jgi:DNA-binding GntR family transcriptional regulator
MLDSCVQIIQTFVGLFGEPAQDSMPNVSGSIVEKVSSMQANLFRTKRAVALDLIRDAIIAQEIAPGSRLVLEDLSQQFGLSMTPIREALPALEAEGFITQSPHKGAVVTPMDRDEIFELYATRSGMESMVAEKAVPKLTESDLSQMEATIKAMSDEEGEWVKFLTRDREFHLILYRAGGSQRWLDTIELLWRRCSRYMLASTAMAGAVSAIYADHWELITACREGDAARAAATTVAHLMHSRDRLLREWPEE